ncbi:MAG TPA: YoaK family protein [Stellaceae bacterium]|nr:YoaK family protein [Stellaceae bacterium]
MRSDSEPNDRHDRGIALALLSFTAGSMDAVAFLMLGNVFTSAMSGNTVLLGVALGQGRMAAASHSIAAFIGYVAGVAGAVVPLAAPARGIERTLVVETLFLAAFAGLWAASGGPAHPPVVYGLIILSAIAMGLQGAVGRSIRVPGIPTVVFTSTLTAIVAALAERVLARERPVVTTLTRRQIETFLVYLASAALTGFAVFRWRDGVPFVPLAAVLALVLGLRLRRLKL